SRRPLRAISTPSVLTRLRISGRSPGECGDVWSTMQMGAGKSDGSSAASARSASIPPDEAPTTTISPALIAPRSLYYPSRPRISPRCLMSQKPDSDQSDYARRVPRAVVGLGASAGGITALREFFAHVSSETGIAWVVILHLSPEHDSKLAEILQTSAHIPVT